MVAFNTKVSIGYPVPTMLLRWSAILNEVYNGYLYESTDGVVKLIKYSSGFVFSPLTHPKNHLKKMYIRRKTKDYIYLSFEFTNFLHSHSFLNCSIGLVRK